jgi:hypothetical protein
MSLKRLLVVPGVLAVYGAGVAFAAHPQADPNQVPVMFLTAHSTINGISPAAVAKAFKSGKADLFIEHGRLEPGQAQISFHIHPGPSFVAVQRGSLTYQEVAAGQCRQKVYVAGRGFVDGGAGRVHRFTAGAAGADYYEVYLLPRRTGPHFTNVPAPSACAG